MSGSDFSTLKVRDTTLRLLRQGKGSPVLYLHGAEGAAGLGPACEAFGPQYSTWMPVHPGYGGSTLPSWLDNVADLANFYLDFLVAQQLEGVHLVGHDLGGWIAADLAVRDCSRLASLTLVSAQGIHVQGVPMVDVFLRSDDVLAQDSYRDAAIARRMLDLQAKADAVAIGEKEVTARLTWSPRGHDPHLAKWLHRIAVPTLVVWGADDRILPPAYGEAWRAMLPGARLEVLADCGHSPLIEQPQAFAQAFDAFASSLGAKA